jgi:hypothetical protein
MENEKHVFRDAVRAREILRPYFKPLNLFMAFRHHCSSKNLRCVVSRVRLHKETVLTATRLKKCGVRCFAVVLRYRFCKSGK